jgi:hypothetical protein
MRKTLIEFWFLVAGVGVDIDDGFVVSFGASYSGDGKDANSKPGSKVRHWAGGAAATAAAAIRMAITVIIDIK